MRPRDTQRQRVYDAERATQVKPSRLAKHLAGRVKSTGSVSIEACTAYVDAVLTQRAVQSRWGRRTIEAQHKVSGTAYGYASRMTLPPWARNEQTILHEIAHALNRRGAAHGPEFVGVLLTLYRCVFGEEGGKAYMEQLRAHRVRRSMADVPEPNRPVVTREQREAAARMQSLTPRMTRSELAHDLRVRIRLGEFGPAGSRGREGALATARKLEKG